MCTHRQTQTRARAHRQTQTHTPSLAHFHKRVRAYTHARTHARRQRHAHTHTHRPSEFNLQLLLPIMYSIIAFTPYLFNKWMRADKYDHLELRTMRNRAISASFKFVNVVYLTVSRLIQLSHQSFATLL